MGKGSSTPAPTKQEVISTSTNLPEYAAPYYTGMLTRAQAYTDPASNPYTPYSGQRIADFNPVQQATQEGILGLQSPQQFGVGSALAATAGLGSLAAADYNPGTFSPQQIGMPNLNQYQMGLPGMLSPTSYGSPQMGTAQTGWSPNLTQYQMSGIPGVSSQQIGAPSMQGASTGWSPNLNQYQMGAAREVSAQQIGAPTMQGATSGYGSGQLQQYQMDTPGEFGQAQAEKYMSPYMQSVLDVQKREAITDAKKAQLTQNLGAARQGTYGGSRQLLATMERERNLGQQLGDIQARGLQSSYENAQGQFERDRTAGMVAGQANLGAKLQTQGLQTQTGLQMALANLSNEQQARVNNQAMQFQAQGMNQEQALRAALANQGVDVTRAQQNLGAQLQTQELGTTTGLQAALANLTNEQQARVNNQALQFQASGMNQEQALRAALANQQTAFGVGQQNLGAQLQTQQLGTETGLQAALANLSSEQQANVQNLAAQLQTQGLNADQALRMAMANQDMQFQTGQQNLGAALQTQQLGAQTGLQALMANQQSDLEAQRLGEQSRQFGAQQGLAGLSQAGQLAQTLGNLGQYQQNADLQRLGAQSQVGQDINAMDQRYLDTSYADFLRQRDYPMELLSYYNSLLRGLPMQLSSTQTAYAPPPSYASQLLGGGLGALGMYQTLSGGG